MKFFANMSLKWTLASIMVALGFPSVILFYLVMAGHDLADMKSTLVIMALYMMTIFTIAFIVGRTLLRKIGRTIEVAKNIAAGNLHNDIETEGTDECSRMLRIMGNMQDNLRERNNRTLANARIKRALDCVNANVMLADANYDIVYLNDTVVEMFQNANQELRKELPNFDANKLMGCNIDVFHKNPAHQRRMLDAMTSVHEAQLNIGNRTFKFIATPVFTDNQERLGTVVEWKDLTEQLAADEAERKNLEEQHLLAVRNGRVKQALDNVRSSVMLTNTKYEIIYINGSARRMFLRIQDEIRKDLPGFDVDTLVGKGLDIFQKNTVENSTIDPNIAEFRFGNSTLLSTLTPVKDHDGKQMGVVIEWIDRTQEIAVENEVQMIVDAALAGDLSQRIELAGKSGFLETLSRGINDMVNVSNEVINDTSRVLSAMAQGNLSETIETDYQGAFGQLKHDANATIAKLTGVIGQIKTGADEINTGSDEISQGNTNLSQRTEEQASSLEETASSMEEMTGTVKQNADNAAQANQLASGARQQAEQGGQVVSQAVSAMSEINNSSKKIADIIGVIDEIAFQTNLLALNAAVEAARAGEQGRGFAVVATEVRNLAQRSATAAKEIKELIEDSVGKVEDGSKLVDQSGQTLEEIVNSVKKVSDIVAEIAAASQEQSSGIEQVNQAIAQMDEMTQQNAALVEQAAAASESMSDQASNMNNLIAFFQVGDDAQGVRQPKPAQSAKERRGTQRPWTSPKTPEALPASATATPKPQKAAAGGADEWEEF